MIVILRILATALVAWTLGQAIRAEYVEFAQGVQAVRPVWTR